VVRNLLASSRAENAARVSSRPDPDVLILGGGVNGVATLRDLALNGVSAILLESGDYCGAASGASTRMAHGGLRYLEGREFRLVAEATRERNRLLRDAPHLVRPLEIVVPLEHMVRGIWRSILRFLGLSQASGPLSLVALKGALAIYETLGLAQRALPGHVWTLRPSRFPEGLSASTRAVVSYFDARIDTPEALVFEMLDEVDTRTEAAALSHVSWTLTPDGAFEVRDRFGEARWRLEPKVIVNASGAWIDAVNGRLGLATRLVRKVKGAHLLIRNAALLERLAGRAFYFDDGRGRMVICLPMKGAVLMGTTEIETQDADDGIVTAEEARYLLETLSRLFSDIALTPRDVIAVTSGIRPLRAGGGSANAAARDHELVEATLPGGAPVFSMVGGKWTTFRAFAETTSDQVMAKLGRPRTVSTRDRRYPGFRPPGAEAAGDPRLSELLDRYGEIGREVAQYCAAAPDEALAALVDYSRREVEWLVLRRAACTLGDLVLRRMDIVLAGRATREALEELAAIEASALGHGPGWAQEEVARALADPRIGGLTDRDKRAAA